MHRMWNTEIIQECSLRVWVVSWTTQVEILSKLSYNGRHHLATTTCTDCMNHPGQAIIMNCKKSSLFNQQLHCLLSQSTGLNQGALRSELMWVSWRHNETLVHIWVGKSFTRSCACILYLVGCGTLHWYHLCCTIRSQQQYTYTAVQVYCSWPWWCWWEWYCGLCQVKIKVMLMDKCMANVDLVWLARPNFSLSLIKFKVGLAGQGWFW